MTPAVDPSPQPRSLHQRILSEIKDRIISGEWPPGYRIPFEHELSTQYCCSRMTVNKALSALAGAGLIERRRKAGSFVSLPHSQSAVLQIRDMQSEVSALGLPYRHVVTLRRRRKVTKADKTCLDLPPSDSVLEIHCTHYAGVRPFCMEARMINLAAVPEAADETFETIAPGAWLVRQVPWTTAEHRIRAIGGDSAVSSALGLPEGTACLVVERRTWSADEPVTFVRLTYPGDAHELVARFSPSQA